MFLSLVIFLKLKKIQGDPNLNISGIPEPVLCCLPQVSYIESYTEQMHRVLVLDLDYYLVLLPSP